MGRFIWILICTTIGYIVGKFWFPLDIIFSTIIGFIVGVITAFLPLESSRIFESFDDFGSFDD